MHFSVLGLAKLRVENLPPRGRHRKITRNTHSSGCLTAVMLSVPCIAGWEADTEWLATSDHCILSYIDARGDQSTVSAVLCLSVDLHWRRHAARFTNELVGFSILPPLVHCCSVRWCATVFIQTTHMPFSGWLWISQLHKQCFAHQGTRLLSVKPS